MNAIGRSVSGPVEKLFPFPPKAAGSGESSSRQPPYDQDDYDEDSNLINVAHGVATLAPPILFGLALHRWRGSQRAR